MSRNEATIYIIDSDDRVVEVNNAFWEFGANNGLVGERESIVGQQLWEFLRGEGLKSVYRRVLTTVRSDMKAFCFPMRCDSLDVQRYMTMTIAPRNDDGVRFIVELDREIMIHAAAGRMSSTARRTVCQSCTKLEVDGDWIPLEDALSAQLFDVGADMIVPDVCDECDTRRHPGSLTRAFVN